jgi:hypothetical protein
MSRSSHQSWFFPLATGMGKTKLACAALSAAPPPDMYGWFDTDPTRQHSAIG